MEMVFVLSRNWTSAGCKERFIFKILLLSAAVTSLESLSHIHDIPSSNFGLGKGHPQKMFWWFSLALLGKCLQDTNASFHNLSNFLLIILLINTIHILWATELRGF